MTIPLDTIPSFTAAEALAIAGQRYALEGAVAPLPSERDQNFLIADYGGSKFVLKIANSNDAPELLDFQNQAMRHVEKSQPGCRVRASYARCTERTQRPPATRGRGAATVYV